MDPRPQVAVTPQLTLQVIRKAKEAASKEKRGIPDLRSTHELDNLELIVRELDGRTAPLNPNEVMEMSVRREALEMGLTAAEATLVAEARANRERGSSRRSHSAQRRPFGRSSGSPFPGRGSGGPRFAFPQGPQTQNWQRGPSESEAMSVPLCWLCGQTGHTARFCWRK